MIRSSRHRRLKFLEHVPVSSTLSEEVSSFALQITPGYNGLQGMLALRPRYYVFQKSSSIDGMFGTLVSLNWMCQSAPSCNGMMLDRELGLNLCVRQIPVLYSRKSCETSRMCKDKSALAYLKKPSFESLRSRSCECTAQGQEEYEGIFLCWLLEVSNVCKNCIFTAQGDREISRKVWWESWFDSHSFERAAPKAAFEKVLYDFWF